MLGMMTVAAHKRIVAEKDELRKKQSALIQKIAAENIRLRLRLSPFTTPRARDAKGRFTKEFAR